MPIVPQSASASYSHFLALPAPHIAGLLTARVGQSRPESHSFTYADPRLGELPAEQRDRLFDATRTLLDVAIAHTHNELNDHALNTALALFRRAVTGQPMRPRNPAQYNAEADADLLEWLVSTSRHRATVQEEVVRDVEARWGQGGVHND